MRKIGDDRTRLDKTEPTLDDAKLNDALSASSREQFKAWLTGNKVGGPLLRAGFPKDWTIADRTGAATGPDR